MGLVKTKILALPRPLEKTITQIAKDLNVSKQYVHQKPLCVGCRKNRVREKRKYCSLCISQDLHNRNRRTGKEFKCYECNEMVYRRPSYIKRMNPMVRFN